MSKPNVRDWRDSSASSPKEEILTATRKLKSDLKCPYCDSPCNSCTGAALEQEGLIPCKGDVSVCYYCGTVLLFADNGYDFATEEIWLEVDSRLRQAITGAIKSPIRFSA